MIRIAICDDEQKQIEIIKRYVFDYFAEKSIVFSIDTTTDGKELLKDIYKYDIVFLDIEIDEQKHFTGIEIGKKLFENINIKIIHVTGHHQYMVDALAPHCFDYVPKPVQRERVEKALDAAQPFLRAKDAEIELGGARIALGEIMYIESAGNYIYFYKRDDTIEKHRCTFAKINELIFAAAKYFAVIHRKYTVNIKYVDDEKGGNIFLANGVKLPFARSKENEFYDIKEKCIKERIV